MRYLHPVAAHEKFIASGIYIASAVYAETQSSDPKQDGDATDEAWAIHELQGGARLIRVDRQAGEVTCLSEALISESGQVERFTMRVTRGGASTYDKLDCFFEPEYIQITRQVKGQKRDVVTWPRPEDALIWLPHTIFQGVPVAQMNRLSRPVVVFSQSAMELPKISTLHCVETAPATRELGRRKWDVRRYHLSDGAWYSLDSYAIIHAVEQVAGRNVTLRDYAHV